MGVEPCSIVLSGTDFSVIAMGAGVGVFLLGYIASAMILVARERTLRKRGPVLLAHGMPPAEPDVEPGRS